MYCEYDDYQDDRDDLCELWCEIQSYGGLICTQCPFLGNFFFLQSIFFFAFENRVYFR